MPPPASVWKTRLIAIFRLLAQAVLIFAVGVFVLVQRGTTMCDPFFLLPFSLFSALLVGPILIGQLRKHSDRGAALLLCAAAVRASGAVLLIVISSLVLLNLAYWEGHLLLPEAETSIWTVVLSLTAALAAGSGLLMFRSSGSMNKFKWVSRALALAAVLLYKYLPPEWWYAIVLTWGITTTALMFEIALIAFVTAALVVVKRREQATATVGSRNSLAF